MDSTNLYEKDKRTNVHNVNYYYGCCKENEITGAIPSIGENGNWFIGEVDTGIGAKGIPGEVGQDGPQGEKGKDGADGPQGERGKDGAVGPQGIQGSKGDTGATGLQGPKGEAGDLNAESLILRPDLWVAGQEYTLGNRLYGRRFTGVITAAANVEFKIMLINIGESAHILACDGWWDARESYIQLGSTFRNSTILAGLFMPRSEHGYKNGDVSFWSISPEARVNAAYDLWIKYTK